jgi:TorA maturation chaperone TorD
VTSPLLADGTAELASVARLVAGWWSRPTVAEIGRWTVCWEPARDAAALIGEPESCVSELEATLAASSAPALLEEHERLLVGPGRVPCAPYESLWRADAPRREQGALMGASAAEVTHVYRELGLQVRVDAHELPDHVCVEWEALAYALEKQADDLAAILLRDHLGRWIPPFASAVAAEARQPFYAALARLTGEWTAALAP